jgi:hypothetical protein
MTRGILLALLTVVGVAAPAAAQERPVYVAPNAPTDQPVYAYSDSAQARFFALMEPHSAQARATYPGAKARFVKGLPAGQSFFAVTRLRDPDGRWEQVFIAVDRIEDGRITGRIWNPLTVVRSFRRGAVHTFREAELVDWMITRPDGTEEGNFVGKFIDEMQRSRAQP